MSGTVGVIATDWGRTTLFTSSLTTLRTPPNTSILWGVSNDRIAGRNKVVEASLDTGSEWLLFIDDDHCFGHDLLMRLLAHDKPIVGSLYLARAVPFQPIAYSGKVIEPDEHDPGNDIWTYKAVNLNDHGPDDLIEVAAIGTGGMLIHSEIFHAMPYPWFEHSRASEDLIFCDKVNELGLGPIYCDLGTRMGHLAPSAIWPTHSDESWNVGFSVADRYTLSVPITHEVEEQPEDLVGTTPK